VSLTVDDVARTYEELAKRGVDFVSPPAKQPWGGVIAHFRDPDGNVLTLLGAPSASPELRRGSTPAQKASLAGSET